MATPHCPNCRALAATHSHPHCTNKQCTWNKCQVCKENYDRGEPITR